MKTLHMAAFILTVVGALNWGLVAVADGFNLVSMLLGAGTSLEKLAYIVIGASAVYIFITHQSDCKACGKGKK